MGKIVTKASEIPAAPFYVLANDTFMSGWGMAEGKINTVILPARNYEEAEIIAANARARSEMRRVRIAYLKPKLSSRIVYSLMDRKTAARWYQPGGFTKGGKRRHASVKRRHTRVRRRKAPTRHRRAGSKRMRRPDGLLAAARDFQNVLRG